MKIRNISINQRTAYTIAKAKIAFIGFSKQIQINFAVPIRLDSIAKLSKNFCYIVLGISRNKRRCQNIGNVHLRTQSFPEAIEARRKDNIPFVANSAPHLHIACTILQLFVLERKKWSLFFKTVWLIASIKIPIKNSSCKAMRAQLQWVFIDKGFISINNIQFTWYPSPNLIY